MKVADSASSRATTATTQEATRTDRGGRFDIIDLMTVARSRLSP